MTRRQLCSSEADALREARRYDAEKSELTRSHQVRRLKRHHTLIRQTHTGITEGGNRLEEGKPRDLDTLRLRVKDVVVPTLRRDVWGENDESAELDKEEVLSCQLCLDIVCRIGVSPFPAIEGVDSHQRRSTSALSAPCTPLRLAHPSAPRSTPQIASFCLLPPQS